MSRPRQIVITSRQKQLDLYLDASSNVISPAPIKSSNDINTARVEQNLNVLTRRSGLPECRSD